MDLGRGERNGEKNRSGKVLTTEREWRKMSSDVPDRHCQVEGAWTRNVAKP